MFRGDRLDLDPNIWIPFFRNMENLTALSLSGHIIQEGKMMKVISQSLIQLTSLDLILTNIQDDGLFALCGHNSNRTFRISAPSCCFIKQCNANTSLKLQKLTLCEGNISKAGIACILTHMPKLRRLLIGRDNVTVDAICEIDMKRKKLGMRSLKLKLTSIACPKSVANMEPVFEGCPKLKHLNFYNEGDNPEHDQLRDEVLATSELRKLKSISFLCASTAHVAENLKKFWLNKGNQIKSLTLDGSRTDTGRAVFHPKDLRYILDMCPGLEELKLCSLSLRLSAVYMSFKNYPGLRNLLKLNIEEVDGEEDSLVVKEIFKIIYAAIDIHELTWEIRGEEKNIYDLLSKGNFLFLKNINLICRY